MERGESMTCKHGTTVEHQGRPELCCEECGWEVVELGPCHGCVYLDNGNNPDRRWCAAFAMYIINHYRRGVEHCSVRTPR
jgi:hypothetical protein